MTEKTSLPIVEPQPYGDVTQLNTARLILDSVGKDVLADIMSDNLMSDNLGLLQTSAAIFEANGDGAQGIFTSGRGKTIRSANKAADASTRWRSRL